MTATTAPIAWMVYTQDGTSAFVTDNPKDFTDTHRALPLYTPPPPPQRKPLTEEQIKPIFDQWKILYGGYTIDLIRAIERAHGIGGEE